MASSQSNYRRRAGGSLKPDFSLGNRGPLIAKSRAWVILKKSSGDPWDKYVDQDLASDERIERDFEVLSAIGAEGNGG